MARYPTFFHILICSQKTSLSLRVLEHRDFTVHLNPMHHLAPRDSRQTPSFVGFSSCKASHGTRNCVLRKQPPQTFVKYLEESKADLWVMCLVLRTQSLLALSWILSHANQRNKSARSLRWLWLKTNIYTYSEATSTVPLLQEGHTTKQTKSNDM